MLLLQGPVGPFFDRLTHWLKGNGVATVNRVAFSGGDEWDCNASIALRFRGALVEWPMFLQYLFTTFKVDCIVLFGQARPHHAKAMVLASLLGIKVVVVEEGYFRPRYLSMELGGVNGYSSTLERYRWPMAHPAPQHVPQVNAWVQSVRMGWYAAVHYAVMSWRHARFPFYLHHKNTSVVQQAMYWLRSWAKKALHYRADTSPRSQPQLFETVDLRQSRRIRQNGQYVFSIEIRVISQYLVNSHATGQPLQNIFNGVAQAANAWFSVANIGVYGNDWVHQRCSIFGGYLMQLKPIMT